MPVSSAGVQTTAPSSSDTFESGAESQVAPLALVCIWCKEDPDRIGESGFPLPFKPLFIGRGDLERDLFLHYSQQRPGQPAAEPLRGGCFGGEAFSRRQALARATAVAIEIVNIGKCPTFVNSVELPRFEGEPMAGLGKPGAFARLAPGDVLYFKGQAAFVCVRRHRTLPVPFGMQELHVFGGPDADGNIGESEAAWELRRLLILAALRGLHVLVQGETGTGKRMASAMIHRYSNRAQGPYIFASGITPSLAESELFGNPANYPNQGAPARKGLFGSAHGGTLFLDEIGDLPLDVQNALLHALDKGGEYRSVGDALARYSDARVIGATSRDDSYFRRDFHMRFIVRVRVPSLRERPEDIPLLVRHLLVEQATGVPGLERLFRQGPSGRVEPNISARSIEYLVRHNLPGNVRELEVMLLQAVDQSPGTVIQLPAPSAAPSSSMAHPASEAPTAAAPDGTPTEAVLVATLERAEWNITRAGRMLGLHRNSVQRLMDKYGVKRGKGRP